MKKFICFFMLSLGVCFLTAGLATKKETISMPAMPDPNTEMPAIFNNSWIGVSMGYKKTYFTNSDVVPGFEPESIKDGIAALRATIGHYFNPYLAMSISLLRGAHSNKFYYPNETYSVSESLFALTLRPTLPLNANLALFLEGGAGFISRKGFDKLSVQVVNDNDIFTGVLGGGIYFNLPYNIFLDLETEYSPRIQSQKQPAIFYVGFGFNYLLKDTHSHIQHDKQYWFPQHVLQLDYVNENIFYADVARYFTPPKSIPVFFDGHIKVGQGLALTYEKTVFHTYKNFSIEWGWSVSQWQSRNLHQDFYTVSIFPEIKVWIFRRPSFDFYFTYSLAGPSYISRVYIDNSDSGSNFTFQDFLGFGAFLGKSKRVALNLRIVHYSNGNSLPHNPGVCAPILVGLAVAF